MSRSPRREPNKTSSGNDTGQTVASRSRGSRRQQSAVEPPSFPEPTATPAATVMFDIDPSVTAGFIHNRYDLLVRGRIVASHAVESVALLLDGAVVSTVGFAASNGSSVRQHAFHVNIP